jgi:dipeptide/tripeptide permease
MSSSTAGTGAERAARDRTIFGHPIGLAGSVGLGTSMSGVLARFHSADNEYAYFGINGAVVIVIGLILAALTPWIRRHMEGVH